MTILYSCCHTVQLLFSSLLIPIFSFIAISYIVSHHLFSNPRLYFKYPLNSK